MLAAQFFLISNLGFSQKNIFSIKTEKIIFKSQINYLKTTKMRHLLFTFSWALVYLRPLMFYNSKLVHPRPIK